MKGHRIVGTLVAGYFENAHRLGLVEDIRFPKKGSSRAPIVTLRIHSTVTLVEGTGWETIKQRYTGSRVSVPVTSLHRVLLAEDEGWVDAAEFLEWSES